MPPELIKLPKQKEKSKPSNAPLWMQITSNALHMGMTLDELDNLRLRDFIQLMDVYAGNVDEGEEQTGPRHATQADIDKLLA